MKLVPPPIRRTKPSDLTAVLQLLHTAGLPTADLTSAPGLQLWVRESEGELAQLAQNRGRDSTRSMP
jgi:hypothetical protein